jgi:hypothetical protein
MTKKTAQAGSNAGLFLTPKTEHSSPKKVSQRRASAGGLKTDSRGQALMSHAPTKERLESEAALMKRVVNVLEMSGVCVLRNTVGFTLYMGRGVTFGLGKGSADLVCIVPPLGRWLCLELKRTKGGKVTPEQEAWLAGVRKFGAVAGVVRSVDEALTLLAEARRPGWGT